MSQDNNVNMRIRRGYTAVIFVGTLWKHVCAYVLIVGLEINANAVFLMLLQEDD